MTNEEINEAIAKHTGWKQCDCGNKDCLAWFRKESWEPEFAPLFATDLNAMHQALKTLNEDQMVSMDHHLDVVVGNGKQGLNYEYFLWSATAAQLAEAFLFTIGKWKE